MELTYCLSKLEKYIFASMIKKGSSNQDLNTNLNQVIYLPLAMNSRKTNNITASMINLILNNKDQEFLPQLNYENDFEGFKNSVLDNFIQGLKNVP